MRCCRRRWPSARKGTAAIDLPLSVRVDRCDSMRLSEAIGLQRSDVDLDEGVLTIPQSKFVKSRLVPLHRTTREALLSYAERRDAHLGSGCGPHFFVAERGGRLLHQYIHRVVWRLFRETGLRRPGDESGPRVHDFRHRFAVRTLLGRYRQGTDVAPRPRCAAPPGSNAPNR